MDSNENMENEKLGNSLKSDGLFLKDAVKSRNNTLGPITFIRGTKKIDGCQVTEDIGVSKALFLSFYFGIGDHRGLVVDVR